MYAAFLFVAVFVGYAVGSAPIVSFHYGARNHAEVHNLSLIHICRKDWQSAGGAAPQRLCRRTEDD